MPRAVRRASEISCEILTHPTSHHGWGGPPLSFGSPWFGRADSSCSPIRSCVPRAVRPMALALGLVGVRRRNPVANAWTHQDRPSADAARPRAGRKGLVSGRLPQQGMWPNGYSVAGARSSTIIRERSS